jgi:hypothetical protein
MTAPAPSPPTRGGEPNTEEDLVDPATTAPNPPHAAANLTLPKGLQANAAWRGKGGPREAWISGGSPIESRAGAEPAPSSSPLFPKEEHEEWAVRERVVKGTIISAAGAWSEGIIGYD